MKQKEEESHRFYPPFHYFKNLHTYYDLADAGKVKNYLKRRSKTQEKSTKYISKIHQDGRSIEEFKKDEKKNKRKLHNLCQPISN